MNYTTLITLFVITLSATNSFATTYFVKNGGDDNANGLTDATAWASVWKVNNHTLNPGDDVYFKTNDIWYRQFLRIDWPGSIDNRVIIGSYYMQNGAEKIGLPSGGNKPTITGGYNSPSNLGNIPPSNAVGLVELRESYITVQNLSVKDSSGYGIITGGSEYNIIEGNEVKHVAGALIYGYKNSNHLIIRNNKGSQCTWSTVDGINPYGGHPGCISVTESSHVLIENNNIRDLQGEGYSVTFAGSNNIIRNNIVSNGRFSGIYTNGGNYTIIENNLIVGGYAPGSYNDMDGIGIAVELVDDGGNSVGSIVRNNLIANVRSCGYADLFDESADAGKVIGVKFIGNTCVGAVNTFNFFEGSQNYTTSEVANNIFWGISNDDYGCVSPTDSDISYHHNSWSKAPYDPDCNGIGDVIGNPTLNHQGDFRLFNSDEMPSIEMFKPQSGSTVENAGALLNTVVINNSNYPLHTEIQPPCSVFDVTELGYDYQCDARHTTTPNMGALESNNNSSDIIRVNAGGGAYTDNLGQTWLADTGFFDNGTTGSPYKTITGTTNQALFDVNRYNVNASPELMYRFAVPNGEYQVILYFAETYTPLYDGGLRVFDVAMENNMVWRDLNVFEEAGGAEVMLRKTSVVSVTDGQLNITFLHGRANHPMISAIEIIPTTSDYSAPIPTTSDYSTQTPTNTLSTPSSTIRMNAGGGEFTDSLGQTWIADTNYFNNGASGSPYKTINGTKNQSLFNVNRYNVDASPELMYQFAVPNGEYQVTLYFAETYSPLYGVGLRVFDVAMESSMIWPDLDVFKEAGGAETMLSKTNTVSVSDGQLNIEFLHGIANHTMISAIEIMPATNDVTASASTKTLSTSFSTIRVNAGGGEITDNIGQKWIADADFFNNGAAGAPYKTVDGTTNQPLFNHNRYNLNASPELMYSFSMPNGEYLVTLYFSETYSPLYGIGLRVFDVTMEGSMVWPELDVFGEAGDAQIMLSKTNLVSVTDGQLNIAFLHGRANHPMVSAIEITQQ